MLACSQGCSEPSINRLHTPQASCTLTDEDVPASPSELDGGCLSRIAEHSTCQTRSMLRLGSKLTLAACDATTFSIRIDFTSDNIAWVRSPSLFRDLAGLSRFAQLRRVSLCRKYTGVHLDANLFNALHSGCPQLQQLSAVPRPREQCLKSPFPSMDQPSQNLSCDDLMLSLDWCIRLEAGTLDAFGGPRSKLTEVIARGGEALCQLQVMAH